MDVLDEIKQKEELQHSADEFKQKLEEDFERSIAELKKAALIAASVGAGLLVFYSVIKLFSGDQKQDNKPEYSGPPATGSSPGFLKTIMAAGGELAASILLGIARKKITEYIESLDKINDNGTTHSEGVDQEKAKGD